jgi:hypothetical protein
MPNEPDDTVELMAWFGEALAVGEWITRVVDVGGGIGRQIDIDSPSAKHRSLVRLEASDDIEAFEMQYLDYGYLQTAANRFGRGSPTTITWCGTSQAQ